MLSGLGNPEACFLSGIKAFFIEHRGYNDLRRTTEGGHDAAAYLYAILLYRDNGGATDDDTAKGYMRRVVGGGSTKSLSYGPPWAHCLGGYQDRLLGGPLGLLSLCHMAPDDVRRKDYGGEVLG
jgi:hypothetical protein